MAELTPYTVPFRVHETIERGRAHTFRVQIFDRDGTQLVPTAAAFTLYNPGGTETLSATDGDDVAIDPGGDVTYPPAAAALDDEDYGVDWRLQWLLTVDGQVVPAENEAMLVRRRLRPMVGLTDLYKRLPTLNPSHQAALHDDPDLYLDQLDESWAEIERRLLRMGNRPNLINSPAELYEPLRNLAIANSLQAMATRIHAHHADTARDFRGYYERSWNEIRFKYDTDDDGRPDSERRRSARPVLWMCDLEEADTSNRWRSS